MAVELYTDAFVTRDLKEDGLREGDLVKVVDMMTAADGSVGYAVEILGATGKTLDVTIVPADALASPKDSDVLCLRHT